MFGAISRTGGVAALVGTLHLVAMLGLTFFLLAALQVIPIEGELVRLVRIAPAALPGTAWLLSWIWAFSATRGLGAMGVLHGIFGVLDAVKRDIAGFPARDDQLPQPVAQGAPNEGMSDEQSDRFGYQVKGFGSCLRVCFGQKIGQPLENCDRARRVTQRRQDLAFGFAIFFPAMRAVR
jgi:hypothetical protein